MAPLLFSRPVIEKHRIPNGLFLGCQVLVDTRYASVQIPMTYCRKKFVETSSALGLIVLLFAAGCSVLDFRLPAIGKAGKYGTASRDMMRPGGAGVRQAVPLLEAIVREDPFYRDSLTLLGRAYYQLGRYEDALQILERGVRVDRDDEIAWLVLGLTQLRLGRDQKGLASLKGGLSLLYKKATKHGYRGHKSWDVNNLVRSSIRKAIFQVQKEGLGNKRKLIGSGEIILYRIDDEVMLQESDRIIEERRELP